MGLLTGSSAVKLPKDLLKLYDSMKESVCAPSVGVDKPEAVVRMAVLDLIKQFVRLTGQHPRMLYIPQSVEAALQIDFGRNLGIHGKIRNQKLIFTCAPVWNADELRVE